MQTDSKTESEPQVRCDDWLGLIGVLLCLAGIIAVTIIAAKTQVQLPLLIVAQCLLWRGTWKLTKARFEKP